MSCAALAIVAKRTWDNRPLYALTPGRGDEILADRTFDVGGPARASAGARESREAARGGLHRMRCGHLHPGRHQAGAARRPERIEALRARGLDSAGRRLSADRLLDEDRPRRAFGEPELGSDRS